MAVLKSSNLPTTTQAPHVAVMPFGQFKGSRLDQLPNDYLLWLSGLDDLRHPLLGHVLREMGRRLVEMDQQAAREREAVGQ